MSEIAENLAKIRENIKASCERAGRNESDVTLIAVSKTKPIKCLKEAYDAGVRDFGENKVQEIVEKYDKMPHDTRFHMIGHLQRNKVRQVIDKVVMIHSVDSYRLAQEISVQAQKRGIEMDILVEVNLGAEETKFGGGYEDTIQLFEEISFLPGLKIKGLMTVAPYVVDSEENREIFHKIWELSVDIEKRKLDNVSMNVLSMGMTGDYTVAIEEGSTCVRVGTGIFGERDYSPTNQKEM